MSTNPILKRRSATANIGHNSSNKGGGGEEEKKNKKESSGRRFPLKEASSILAICVIVVFVVIPLIAFNLHVPLRNDLSWWQTTVVYQIYPRSFQDSNADGIGDLKGIESRLDYLRWLGIEAIWLSPFYTSPMVDFGYDISNYTQVDTIFGNLNDFDDLIKSAHERNMKIIIDIVPNHTSDQHKWFLESVKGNSKYAHYYVWNEGKIDKDGNRQPPTNWLNFFKGSAWQWNDNRQAYYLHQFTKEQPDLNFRNSFVRQEILNVFQFWLDRGVDGFRVDVAPLLYEVEPPKDEPPSGNPDAKDDEYESLRHIYTHNQPETHEVIKSWRKLFDKHEKKTGKYTFMVLEAWDTDMDKWMSFYHSGADMPFNFLLPFKLNLSCNSKCIFRLIDLWMSHMPLGKWPNWVLGNHDQPRISGRIGKEFTKHINILLLTLPGTPTAYYGDEIGMEDIQVSYEQTQDPYGKNYGKDRYKLVSRDPNRSPMQWTSQKHSGFSTAQQTWLPVHPNYKEINVQQQNKTLFSNLHVFRQLLKLRKVPAILYGSLNYTVVEDNLLTYVRWIKGVYNSKFIIILNFDNNEKKLNFHQMPSEYMPLKKLPKTGKIILDSLTTELNNNRLNEYVHLNNVHILEKQALIIEFY